MLSPVFSLSRRLLLALGLGLIVAGGLALAPALSGQDRPVTRQASGYASVTVDTAPLGASLYGPTGERLRAMMQAEMKRRFRITGDATQPHLLVRITEIVIPANFGLDNQSGGAALQTTDRMDGETLVVAPDGKVLQRFPVTVTAPSSTALGENGVEADFRRLGDLVRSFASWSARYAGSR